MTTYIIQHANKEHEKITSDDRTNEGKLATLAMLQECFPGAIVTIEIDLLKSLK